MRSEISGVPNSANTLTSFSSGRSISARTRKPGPGVISADFGFSTGIASSIVVACHLDLRAGPHGEQLLDPVGELGQTTVATCVRRRGDLNRLERDPSIKPLVCPLSAPLSRERDTVASRWAKGVEPIDQLLEPLDLDLVVGDA